MQPDSGAVRQLLGLLALLLAMSGLARCAHRRDAQAAPPKPEAHMRRGMSELDEKRRLEAARSLWDFYRVLEGHSQESISERVKGFAMMNESLHPWRSGEDRFGPAIGGGPSGETRSPWWMAIVQLETAGLVRAKQDGLRLYRSGACLRGYERGLASSSLALQTVENLNLSFDSEAALEKRVDDICSRWGHEDRARPEDEIRRLRLMLASHPTLRWRLLKTAEAEAHNVDLGFRNVIY